MKTRVLLVDDNPSDRLIVKTLGEKCELMADEAEDGFAALEMLQDESIQFSVCIIDLQMPKMPGLELVKRIRRIERYKNIPILIMSARNRPIDVQLAVQSGATDYIIKPMDLQILQEKLKRLTSKSAEAWKLYPLKDEEQITQVSLLAKAIAVNEIGAEILLPFEVPVGSSVSLNLDILNGRGVGVLIAAVTSKRRNEQGVIYTVSFVGLTEADRKKIRLCCREVWTAGQQEAVKNE